MKIKKKLTKKKYLLIGTIIVVAALIAGAIYFTTQSNQNTEKKSDTSKNRARVNTVNLKPPTKEQKKSGEQKKQESIEASQAPATTPQAADFAVTITAANQNGALFQVRSLITNLSNEGTCQLQMKKGESIIEKTVSTQALASSSTCKGFDIPLSELSDGTWNLKITVNLNGQSVQATKSVEIRS